MRSHDEVVETFRLVLQSGFVLDLVNTIYIPSFSKNLISMSKLIQYGFEFKFSGPQFYLHKGSSIVGFGSLVSGLYKLNLDAIFE